MKTLEALYQSIGAEFLTDIHVIAERMQHIKAFVFDWDGVFNNAIKNENKSSNFNEADSMGTNMLRFSHYLLHQTQPKTAIISGERNAQSFFFTQREHFDSCYFKVNDKIKAMQHFCEHHNISISEVCYFFDDVLDLSIAQECGTRILINRKAGVLFKEYIRKNKLADYITANDGGHYGVREACELLMGIRENFDECMQQRTEFSSQYNTYI
ncbi:MAG: phosphatase, partial [Bacteroidia bacterium]